ncbi:MAG: hypothetical protein QG632_6 [Candidatus Dependentiae bacterium]|nr:hypothetical protein [Candidatus Dependentiae bacterium]
MVTVDTAAAFTTLENEYTPQYCLQLEAAYGPGMMSEGGAAGIEQIFGDVPLHGKRLLDIGAGLGGAACYLAAKYQARVTGLEVNSWMVSEATKRIPQELKNAVDFVLSTSNSNWPMASQSFDIIYSKGVLTHVSDKNELFVECRRLLKADGLLIITDWLSSESKKWGPNVARLVELEKLSLFAESESGYCATLERNGFSVLSVRDDSGSCIEWNRQIIARLQDPALRESHLKVMTELERVAAIEGYEAIIHAMEQGEARMVNLVAKVKDRGGPSPF